MTGDIRHPTWTDNNGTTHRLSEMSEEYLQAVIRFLNARAGEMDAEGSTVVDPSDGPEWRPSTRSITPSAATCATRSGLDER